MGVPPVIIHFILGISLTKTIQLLGYPHDYGHLHLAVGFRARRSFEAERHRPRLGITSWYSTASQPRRCRYGQFRKRWIGGTLCVYIYMFIYVCMYIYVYVYIYICMYVYLCLCIYVYMFMYIYIYIYMYVCMYVCIYIYRAYVRARNRLIGGTYHI